MEARSIPLSLHFLNFPNTPEFVARFYEKLEELKRRDFVEQNYGVEVEKAYRYISKTKHAIFDEISIIEEAQEPRRRFVWKELFVDKKQQLLEIIAICELRLELQVDPDRGLPLLHRYIYKKVPDGWISSKFRIRVFLEWVGAGAITEKISAPNSEPTSFLRKIFRCCLQILHHLHAADVFIIDLRPEYISYDEQNQEHPFKLMDRLVDGVDPIKRITQSKSRRWTVYCHPKIWEIYLKEIEDSYKRDFSNRELLRSMDIYALAMIVLQLCIKDDFSLLYAFNGSFNQKLLNRYLDQLSTEHSTEDTGLCEILRSILSIPNPTKLKSALDYIQQLNSTEPPPRPSGPAQHRNPLLTTQASSPQDNRLLGKIENRTAQDATQNAQMQEAPPNQYTAPIIPQELSKQPVVQSSQQVHPPETPGSGKRSAQEILKELEKESRPAENEKEAGQTHPKIVDKSSTENPASLPAQNKDPFPNANPVDTERHKLLPTQGNSDQQVTPIGNNDSQAPPNTDTKKQPRKILGQPADTKERSGCPCCTLI